MLLKDKNILITGGGKNIGRAFVLEMGKEGANIFFTDIDQVSIEKVEGAAREGGIRAEGFLKNVVKETDSDELLDMFDAKGITIDVLVNNVGIGGDAHTLEDLSMNEWRNIFDHNVFGPLYLTKKIVERMKERHVRGSVIFVSSIHQEIVRRIPSYSASKAAIGMVIKEFALDLAPSGIRVNGIAPGYVAVDEKGNTIRHDATPLYQASIDPTYIGRAGVYLASDHFSADTTGAVLKIDAGLSLHNHLVDEIPLR